MGLADIIKKVINMLPEIMTGVGVTFVVGMVLLIIGGGITQQALLGNIPVDGNTTVNTSGTVLALTNVQDNLTAAITTVGDQASTAVSYLPLIIIMAIALGFLGFLGVRAFKKGSNGSL